MKIEGEISEGILRVENVRKLCLRACHNDGPRKRVIADNSNMKRIMIEWQLKEVGTHWRD